MTERPLYGRTYTGPDYDGPAGDPSLPYPEPGGQEHTAGHSGSDTSRERATTERNEGVVAARQMETLRFLGRDTTGLGGRVMRGRWEGLTVKELVERTGWHHGQASSTLSTLHKGGRIERLATTRDRCKVYVLPEYVNGRATEKPGRTKANQPKGIVLTDVEEQAVRNLRHRHNYAFGSEVYVRGEHLRILLELVERSRG